MSVTTNRNISSAVHSYEVSQARKIKCHDTTRETPPSDKFTRVREKMRHRKNKNKRLKD